MIVATLATLALAVLVYAFILSPMLRELRGTADRSTSADADLALLTDAGIDADAASNDAPAPRSGTPTHEQDAPGQGSHSATGTVVTQSPRA